MPFQPPRGTKDILPNEVFYWQEIEDSARRLFSLYNYKEIRTPIIEDIALFKRSLGDSTEIVQKQMFTIQKGQDVLVLRPEATASIARAYLEHKLEHYSKINKLFYIGPMFRAERPQKGRLRQFHHIGVEAIGSEDPLLDVEVIELMDNFLKTINIDRHTILINSLGCSSDKNNLSQILKKKLSKYNESLCQDCKVRVSRNVFRVLDCKNENCRKIVNSLNLDNNYLCDNCLKHFEVIVDGLKQCGVNFRVEKFLVRGLDYYSRTVFEVVHPDLGAQNALGAGGRYDYLFNELAAKEIGAVGFAIGEERVLLVRKNKISEPKLVSYIITLGERASRKGLEILQLLRKESIPADMEFSSGSLKSKLNQANKIGARFSIIIGDNELEKEIVILKDMQQGTQREVSLGKLLEQLRGSLC